MHELLDWCIPTVMLWPLESLFLEGCSHLPSSWLLTVWRWFAVLPFFMRSLTIDSVTSGDLSLTLCHSAQKRLTHTHFHLWPLSRCAQPSISLKASPFPFLSLSWEATVSSASQVHEYIERSWSELKTYILFVWSFHFLLLHNPKYQYTSQTEISLCAR